MDGAAPDDLFFEAIIVPHRSLSRRGRLTLFAALAALGCVSGTVFFTLGAYPVVGFTGAELPLAIWLVHRHAMGARASEVVTISPSGLRIRRTTPDGKRLAVDLPADWVQVVLRERQGRIPRLMVGHRGEFQEIGRSLGEDEKRDLARAIGEALYRWRNPVFS